MHIQMIDQIKVNSPASKTWKVLAHDFGSIGDWASIITRSKPIVIDTETESGKVCGRVCKAKGFGDTEEELTHYNDSDMCFTYKAIKGLPFFIKIAENNWSVHSISENESLVKSRAEIEMSFFPGIILAPIFKLGMGKAGKRMFEELKYYIENDKPHPRKEKQ